MISRGNPGSLPNDWADALERTGYRFNGAGYDKNGYRLQLTTDRLSLMDLSATPPPDLLSAGMTEPGWWKWVKEQGTFRRVFEVTTQVIQHNDSIDSSPLSLQALLEWAEQTAHPPFPSWTPSERDV